ncbi:MAG: guanylate kinase [Gemmatimonadales bacterium]|nr:guanylate kinase [Gemmatimonadales bacterium]
MTPFLLVLSSPSGGGKTTIARRVLAARPAVGYSISATTRAMRPGEVHGKDYWFLTPEEFEARVMGGEFLEHASYNGRRYGTLRSEVERHFAAGRHVVLDIEVNGARQVRRQLAGAVLVFVVPPTGRALVERLAARRTEDRAALDGRLAIAAGELAAVGEYDYVVVNADLEQAVHDVLGILDAEGRRVARQDDLDIRTERLRREIAEAAKQL